ncbi:hypothetical protein SPRG_19474 [Saprolegnia parasitica CBS 223.65]|uniref:RxLR effector protein n=1 Tax=Saprolegnia parasitica (strain CBS 223.65) TaxID=695850 RepID=A0A067CYW9_SAPPC|nr:hypothetical protein SPRG_19474 [Saprolegnia parasitica CBS 223.65]KDO32012.1 hypothetical protein SPRG_19474 [Saprolegnia parasitica CBS 223.65]|eukprot:XP_012197402.1 hypothetical protein SPRG_19474 [Saprolegnia parasitica CBS 223.65]
MQARFIAPILGTVSLLAGSCTTLAVNSSRAPQVNAQVRRLSKRVMPRDVGKSSTTANPTVAKKHDVMEDFPIYMFTAE